MRYMSLKNYASVELTVFLVTQKEIKKLIFQKLLRTANSQIVPKSSIFSLHAFFITSFWRPFNYS